MAARDKELTVREWVECAPPEILRELQSITTMNFLRRHRYELFQTPRAMDGSMSESCKVLFHSGYSAVDEMIRTLESLDESLREGF